LSSGNVLYYGDNLDVLRQHIKDESVDLIYLDPPFNSNASYNVLFSNQAGVQSAAQIKAFSDTWHWDEVAAMAFHETVEAGGEVSRTMQAFRTLLGDSNMLAYLSMMAPRLMEFWRVLKPTGSLYLHCDSTASHYLKILLDSIFGPLGFRNEIVWKRFNFHADAKRFGKVTDRILFYTKGPEFIFNPIRVPYSDEYIADKFTHSDPDGRLYRLSDLNPPAGRGPVYEFNGVTKPWRITEKKMRQLDTEGRIYKGSKVAQLKRYLDELEGQAVHELWTDVAPINPRARERLGYPTQKPLALMERIIEASSDRGDVVLDPFCGCGTTIEAAQQLDRRWIGVDITYLATHLIKSRLRYAFEDKAEFKVIGEPTRVEEAVELGRTDPYQFQFWALGLVGARSAEEKKGADRGIDGRLYFHETPTGPTKQAIFSVKAGKVQVQHLRDLRGVVDREKAQIGVLISLQPPTGPMRKEAASAGFYESSWGNFPTLQLLTVEELLNGKGVQMPPIAHTNATFKRARYAHPKFEQGTF